MPTIATALSEGFSSGNTKRYYIDTIHTAAAPQTVTQRARLASSTSSTAGGELVVALTTSANSTSIQLKQKIVAAAEVRFPVECTPNDVLIAIGYLRDLVASDEFVAAIIAQQPIA